MQITEKKNLDQKLGKLGMWSGKAGNAVKYLGGISEYDELIEQGKIDISIEVGI